MATSAEIAGVVFDLEGTLVDFQWHLEEAEAELRAGFRRLGFPETLLAEGTYSTMWNGALSTAEPPADERALREVLGPIYDRWDLDALSRWRPRTGAAVLLERLAAGGLRVGMVSNIGRLALAQAIERFGLAPFLDPVVTRDDVRLMKPDGGGIGACLAQWHLKADEVLMVGDSRSDLGAARAAGVRVAIVKGGETPVEAFAADPPSYLVDHLLQIEELVAAARAPRG